VYPQLDKGANAASTSGPPIIIFKKFHWRKWNRGLYTAFIFAKSKSIGIVL